MRRDRSVVILSLLLLIISYYSTITINFTSFIYLILSKSSWSFAAFSLLPIPPYYSVTSSRSTSTGLVMDLPRLCVSLESLGFAQRVKPGQIHWKGFVWIMDARWSLPQMEVSINGGTVAGAHTGVSGSPVQPIPKPGAWSHLITKRRFKKWMNPTQQQAHTRTQRGRHIHADTHTGTDAHAQKEIDTGRKNRDADRHQDTHTHTITAKSSLSWAHRHFYTQTLLHTDAFTHRRFYTKTLLHTDAFTHRCLYTHNPLLTNAFTRRCFHTQKLLHTDAFTHRCFYTQMPLHT